MSIFPDFLETHGPPTQAQPVPVEAIARYQERLPADLLAFWQEVGWCAFGEGLLWLVDPEQLADPLEEWLGHREALAILRTAFGDVLFWHEARAHYLDVIYNRVHHLTGRMDILFEVTLCDESYWDNALDRPTYRQAQRCLGAPTRDAVYTYVPALALGGSEDPAALQKVGLREHLSFLAQLRG